MAVQATMLRLQRVRAGPPGGIWEGHLRSLHTDSPMQRGCGELWETITDAIITPRTITTDAAKSPQTGPLQPTLTLRQRRHTDIPADVRQVCGSRLGPLEEIPKT